MIVFCASLTATILISFEYVESAALSTRVTVRSLMSKVFGKPASILMTINYLRTGETCGGTNSINPAGLVATTID